MIGKIEKRFARADFLTHEDQWNLRRQQLERHCRFKGLSIGQHW